MTNADDEKGLGSGSFDTPREDVVTSRPIPPPDTPSAWIQVLGGFIGQFNCWGLVVTFGVYQSYYASSSTIIASSSAIAWIGSTQAFLLLFIGALSGRIFDAGYLRHLLFTGTFLIVFGLMMTSLSTAYWQALLSHGLCVGLGMGCLLVPSIGAPSTWFIKYRGLAIGVGTCGAAVGGIVNPIVIQHLILTLGFPWAIRISAFIVLSTMTIAIIIMKQRLPPRKRGRFFEFIALKEIEFTLYAVGMMFSFMGFYQFYNFIQDWARSIHLNTQGLELIYLLPITNAASIFGRIGAAVLSDVLGPMNCQIPSIFISGVLVYAWLASHTLSPTLAIAILYGVASGGLVALPPAAVASLTRDMTRFGARMGVVLLFMSVGSLVGSPVMGAVIQSGGENDYDGARGFAGSVLVLGGVLVGGVGG